MADLIIILSCVAIVSPTTAAATGIFHKKYDPWPNVTIPDDGGYYNRRSLRIDVSGIPSDARIKSVKYTCWVDHPYRGDLCVDLTAYVNNRWVSHRISDREGGSANNVDKTETFTTFNGGCVSPDNSNPTPVHVSNFNPNGQWYLVAWDNAPGDEGALDGLELWIEWETPCLPGSIQATLRNHNGASAAGSQTKFVLYPGTVTRTGNNPYTYTGLEPRTSSDPYWVEAYHKGPFGEYEYWGSVGVSVSCGEAAAVTISRVTPYCEDFWFEYNGVRIDHASFVPPGTTLVPKARVRNRDSQSRTTQLQIGWRFGSSGAAVGTRSSSVFTVGANSTTTVTLPSFTLTPGVEGDIYAYVRTDAYFSGWSLTESWDWTKMGEARWGAIRATLRNHDGQTTLAANTKFILYPGTIVRIGSNPYVYTGLPPRTSADPYWVEGYQKGPFGEYEYWGSVGVSVSCGEAAAVTISRVTPYCEDFWFEYNGVRVDESTLLPPGAMLVPRVQVRNKHGDARRTQLQIGWRFGTSGAALGTRQSSEFTIGGSSATTVTLGSIALPSGTEGDIYAFVRTDAYFNDWSLTDSWDWTKMCVVKSHRGDVTVDVRSSDLSSLPASAMNAIQLAPPDWDPQKVRTVKPVPANPYTFSNVDYGQYEAAAYCWDMLVAKSGTIEHQSAATNLTLVTFTQPKPLHLHVRYSNGTGQFAGAGVFLDSWDGDRQTWVNRVSGTTDSTGSWMVNAWPTTSPGEKYQIRVKNESGIQVFSGEPYQVNEYLGATYTIITTQNPVAEIVNFVPPTGLKMRGQEVHATVTLRNTANAAQSFWAGLSFAGPESQGWPDGWYDVKPIQTSTLLPGSEETIHFTFRVPYWLPEGSYSGVTAVWSGYDATNNLMCAPRYDDDTSGMAFSLDEVSDEELRACQVVSTPMQIWSLDVPYIDEHRTGFRATSSLTIRRVMNQPGICLIPELREGAARLVIRLEADDTYFGTKLLGIDQSQLMLVFPKNALVANSYVSVDGDKTVLQDTYVEPIIDIGLLVKTLIDLKTGGTISGTTALLKWLTEDLRDEAIKTVALELVAGIYSSLADFNLPESLEDSENTVVWHVDFSRDGWKNKLDDISYYSSLEIGFDVSFDGDPGPLVIVNDLRGKLSFMRTIYDGIVAYGSSVEDPDSDVAIIKPLVYEIRRQYTIYPSALGINTSSEVLVTAPTGGEEWLAGTTQEICWTSTGQIGDTVRIDLYDSHGGVYKHTVVSATENDGLFDWSIPTDFPSRADYRIRITALDNTSVWDQSDSDFSIVKPHLEVTPSSLSLPGYAGVEQILLNNSGTGTLHWSADVVLGGEWLGISPQSGTGEATVTVTCAENTSGSPRTGRIRVTARGAEGSPVDITVTQDKGALVYAITVLAAPTAGGSVSGGGEYQRGSLATVTAIANPGYAFLEWREDGLSLEDVEGQYSFDVTCDRTLVAHFGPTAGILVQADPPDGGTVSGSGVFLVGSEQQISATANAGWVFTGWSDGYTANSRTITVPSGGTTYIAEFRPEASRKIYVDADATNDPGTGSEGDPFKRIQDAIEFAIDGDSVIVLPGTYYENLVIDSKNVTLRSAVTANADAVTVHGSGNRVLLVLNSSVDIRGLNICYGETYSDYRAGPLNGAGIYADSNSSVRMSDCVIAENRCNLKENGYVGTVRGVGVCIEGQGEISNCVIADNTVYVSGEGNVYAEIQGVGGFLQQGSISGCVIHGNEVVSFGATPSGLSTARGGGLYCGDGSTVECSLIHDNLLTADVSWFGYIPPEGQPVDAVAEGAGVYLEGGKVSNSLVYGNQAIARGNSNEAADMFECDAMEGGGGNAFALGGGVYALSSELVNNTVCDCSVVAEGGKGVRAEYYGDEWWQFDCITYYGNAVMGGGGAYIDGHSSLRNTILWSNTPNQLAGHDCTNVAFCNIATGDCVGINDNMSVWPGFVNPDSGDYRLLPGSPCIDAGDGIALTTRDLLGRPRCIDGNCDGQARTDLGAYEFLFADYGDFVQDCRVDLADFAVVSEHWGVHGIPQGHVTVDGDLSDWGHGDNWIALDQVFTGDPSDVTDARYAMRWSEDPNRLYLAVVVEDTDHVFVDEYGPWIPGISWKASDRLEVYCQGNGEGGIYGQGQQEIAQQYIVGPDTMGGAWAVLGFGDADNVVDSYLEYAVRVDGNTIVYELGIVPFDYYDTTNGEQTVVTDLGVNKTISLDVVVGTRQSSGLFGMLAENLMPNKSTDAGQFGCYLLLPSAVNCGGLPGDVDGDCHVDIHDLTILADNWVGMSVDSATVSGAGIGQDGIHWTFDKHISLEPEPGKYHAGTFANGTTGSSAQ